jgi:DNA-binding response OmpR family regulator
MRKLLAREKDFDVLEAADLDHVTAVIDWTCHDVALVDVELPRDSGVAAVTELAKKCEASRSPSVGRILGHGGAA